MSNKPIALLDANVLFPLELRNLLMQLAYIDTYPARWTNDIHKEWIHAVLRKNPGAKPERLARTRTQMDEAVPNCLITGYEYMIPTLELPDPDDRHVLAAAIKGECDFIVTRNLSDFPSDILAQYGIRAQSPDDFLTQLLDEAPDDVCLAIREIRARLTRPHYSVDEYLYMLERQSLPQTVAALRKIDPSAL